MWSSDSAPCCSAQPGDAPDEERVDDHVETGEGEPGRQTGLESEWRQGRDSGDDAAEDYDRAQRRPVAPAASPTTIQPTVIVNKVAANTAHAAGGQASSVVLPWAGGAQGGTSAPGLFG